VYSVELFELNVDRARAWLTELIVAWEVQESGEAAALVWSSAMPSIGLVWEPRAPGQEESVYLLIRAVQDLGILSRPVGMTIDFEYVDDGDDGQYRWLLDIVSPRPLRLAGLATPIAALGDEGAFGIEAALGVLRETVRAANLLAQQLSQYIAAGKPPGHGA
jgi:hypothetical protein